MRSPRLDPVRSPSPPAIAAPTRAPAELARTAHELRARPHVDALHRRPRARRAAGPAPPPTRILGIRGRETAGSSEEIQHICQADDARQTAGHVRTGEHAGADCRPGHAFAAGEGARCASGPLVVAVRGGWWAERRYMMCRSGRGWDAAGGRRSVDDPHAMRSRGTEFGDGVSEGAEGCDLGGI